MTASLSPVVKYHGLARRYLVPSGFLMRPLLNGGTLGGPGRSTLKASYSPQRGVKVGIGMCAGSFLGTVLLHGVPSTREAWFDAFARVGLIVVLCTLLELVRWHLAESSPE